MTLVREERSRKWEREIHQKYLWDTGVSVLGAFKLDNFQPVELFLSQNYSSFPPFILGSPIPYYPREKKAEYEKREFTINGWDTRVSVLGAFKLDHLQPVELFLFSKLFHFPTIHTGESNSLLPQREEGRI